MTNWAHLFTDLLFYAHVGIHQVRILVFDITKGVLLCAFNNCCWQIGLKVWTQCPSLFVLQMEHKAVGTMHCYKNYQRVLRTQNTLITKRRGSPWCVWQCDYLQSWRLLYVHVERKKGKEKVRFPINTDLKRWASNQESVSFSQPAMDKLNGNSGHIVTKED